MENMENKEKVELGALTEDQKKALWEEMKLQEREKKILKQLEREAYIAIKDELVTDNFARLEGISEGLKSVKSQIFDGFQVLLNLKQQLYSISEDQMSKQLSHTFTLENGNKSIMLGQNVVDGWDTELAGVGVAKVNEWLASKLTDDNKMLVDMIRDLLRPSKEGVLKANRVLELAKRAREQGDEQLIDAVNMLQDAYRPVTTTTFVRAKFRNEQGQDEWLKLSMSN